MMNQPLRTLLTSLALCLLTTACFGQADNWQHAIHGKWKCDAVRTLEVMTENGATEAQTEAVQEILPGIAIEFTEGSLVMKMGADGFNDERKATYTVEESDEEKKWLKLEIVTAGEGTKTGEITLLEEGSMQIETDGTILVFKLIPEEKSDG